MGKNITIGNTSVYHTYPEDNGKHPGLIVIEEIWGVNDHIRSVADRFAKEGFSVLSPELLPADTLNVLGSVVQTDLFDPEKRNAMQPQLRAAMAPIQQPEYAAATIATLKACVDYLLADPNCNGKVGVVGFCFGGTYSFHLAANDPRVLTAAPFYGHPPTREEIPNIACPITAFYGDQDTALAESLPKLKDDMEKAGKDFEAVVYPDTGHAFFNDTNTRQYKPDAAMDAWQKVIPFLKENLN